jgi:RNA polymerase sigma-70 factor (ECF subfamily)
LKTIVFKIKEKYEMTDDEKIISLFFSRSEEAITETQRKYGRLGMRIAENILGSREDAEECVSDAMGILWNRIPPEMPNPLLPYFLRIVRNISLNRRRSQNARKRSNGEDLLLDELADVIAFDDREEEAERIREALDGFIAALPQKDRILFVRRYWFEDSIGDISVSLGISENNAKVKLTRLKAKLRKHLEKEGIDV